MLLELITAAKLEMPEDIMEMLSHFDDEELADQPQSPDSHETDTIAQQALDQELPF